MDLNKALDTLDLQIVLDKLKYYGVNGTPLKCFSSYLTGRQPQGSILGTFLY